MHLAFIRNVHVYNQNSPASNGSTVVTGFYSLQLRWTQHPGQRANFLPFSGTMLLCMLKWRPTGLFLLFHLSLFNLHSQIIQLVPSLKEPEAKDTKKAATVSFLKLSQILYEGGSFFPNENISCCKLSAPVYSHHSCQFQFQQGCSKSSR